MNITLLLLIAAVVGSVILTIIMMTVKKKKTVNTVMFCTIAIAVIVSVAYNNDRKKDLKEYSTYGNGLSQSVIYEESADGYHFFKYKNIGKDNFIIAVPDDVELSGYIRTFDKSGVVICLEEGTDVTKGESIKHDGKKCYIAENTEKIVPDYKWMLMCLMFALAAMTAAANIISAIIESIRGSGKR